MGTIYLLLAVLSSASMAVILKIFSNERGNRYGIIVGNYLTCVLIAFSFLPDKGIIFNSDPSTAVIGVISGFIFAGALLLMQHSIGINGAILTTAFARLGLIVPLILSIFIFLERPSVIQVTGIILVLAAVWIITADRESIMHAGRFGKKAGKVRPVLLLGVLVLCGLGDAMAKVFEDTGERDEDELYFLFVFTIALVIALAFAFTQFHRTGEKISIRALAAGALAGIPNYFSSLLLLKALEHLPAFIVYPCFSTGAIVVVMIVGRLFLKERPNGRKWAGLILILAALVLLNAGRSMG